MMIEEKTKGTYDLDIKIYRLLQDEPFFARLSRALDKRPMPGIKTAGIRYNKETRHFEMVYSPEFMGGLSELHQKWVIKHELYHASLGHCTERNLDEITGGNKKIANCAMDLAINSLPGMLHEAPDFVLIPGRKPFENIHHNERSANWYANKIVQQMGDDNDEGQGQPCKDGQPGEGQGGSGGPDSFDSHADFGSGDGTLTDDEICERAIAQDRLGEAIAKAAKECDVGDGEKYGAGWGSVSCSIRERIIEFANRKSKLNPETVFRSFCKASVAANKKTSVTKRNRRLPGKKFGRRVEHRANIAISVDQSGSVSDELLGQIFEFMNGMAQVASFTLIPFDDRVFEEKVSVWKKGDKRKRARVLNGGTNFNAPTKFVNKKNFDGHIIITDMMAPKPVRSNCQRMWITDDYGSRCTYFKPVGERVLVL